MNAIHETTALLQAYRSARAALTTARLQAFPHRCCVRVNSARYRGVGVALTLCSEGVPLEQLPVRLENGNTWHYPLEDCARIHALQGLTVSERHSLLRAYGRPATPHRIPTPTIP